jgi:hypothetical protein
MPELGPWNKMMDIVQQVVGFCSLEDTSKHSDISKECMDYLRAHISTYDKSTSKLDYHNVYRQFSKLKQPFEPAAEAKAGAENLVEAKAGAENLVEAEAGISNRAFGEAENLVRAEVKEKGEHMKLKKVDGLFHGTIHCEAILAILMKYYKVIISETSNNHELLDVCQVCFRYGYPRHILTYSHSDNRPYTNCRIKTMLPSLLGPDTQLTRTGRFGFGGSWSSHYPLQHRIALLAPDSGTAVND